MKFSNRFETKHENKDKHLKIYEKEKSTTMYKFMYLRFRNIYRLNMFVFTYILK